MILILLPPLHLPKGNTKWSETPSRRVASQNEVLEASPFSVCPRFFPALGDWLADICGLTQDARDEYLAANAV